MTESFWKRIWTGYKDGEPGYVRSCMHGHGCSNVGMYEFQMNAPVIWVISRGLWALFFVLPLICLFSLIAKLQGKHAVKEKTDENGDEIWTWEK